MATALHKNQGGEAIQNLSDSRDCAFEAFVTNLGKYNEGYLVGEWVKFPITNEEMQEVFKRIGINRRYEEWFITDYECPDFHIYDLLGEYEDNSVKNAEILIPQYTFFTSQLCLMAQLQRKAGQFI